MKTFLLYFFIFYSWGSFCFSLSGSTQDTLSPIHICEHDSILVFGNFESSTGYYIDSQKNINGYDSIIVQELIVFPTIIVNNPSDSACDSIQINENWYYNTQIVKDTFSSVTSGCDSVVYTPIEINTPFTIGETIVACDSFEVRGNWYYTTQVVVDTFASQVTGCDSILSTTLLINLSDTVIHPVITGCDFVFYDWVTYYTDTLIETNTPGGASSGCTLYEFQQIYVDTVNNGASLNNLTITSNQTGATYQWIDCTNGDTIITGETNQSFTAFANGDYAVIITNGSCIDTSNCVTIATVDVTNIYPNKFNVYPNPTNGLLTIDFGTTTNLNTTIEIIDAIGKTIKRITTNNQIQTIDLSGYENGIYFVKVEDAFVRTIKQ